jgi:hypothetical protein
MSFTVTSWFIDQTSKAASKPIRKFTLSGSDYSSRVRKWPTITWDIEDTKSITPAIQLDNTDGEFNSWVSNPTLIPDSSTNTSRIGILSIGFTHPNSSDEYLDVYNGNLKSIRFNKDVVTLAFKDKLFNFSELTIGDDDSPVTNSGTATDVQSVMWFVITSYGKFNSSGSDTNTDIDIDIWETWRDEVNADNIQVEHNWTGEKVFDAFKNLLKWTDSYVYIDGTGKLRIYRIDEASASDKVLDGNQYEDLFIELDEKRVVNRQGVFAQYNSDSDSWGVNNFSVDSDSQVTYGLRENILKDETVWFPDATNAAVLGNRKLVSLSDIPRVFDLKTPLIGIEQEVGDTIRLTETTSFYGVTSADGWRITRLKLNMQETSTEFMLNAAWVFEPFYLDIDFLDGPKRLL